MFEPINVQINYDTDQISERMAGIAADYLPRAKQAFRVTENLRKLMGTPVFASTQQFADGLVEVQCFDSDNVKVLRLNVVTKLLREEVFPAKSFIYSGLMMGPDVGFVPTMGMGAARKGITPSPANVPFPYDASLKHMPYYAYDPEEMFDPLADGFAVSTSISPSGYVQSRHRPATLYSGLLAVAVQAGLGIGLGSKLAESAEYWGFSTSFEGGEPEWFTNFKKTRVLPDSFWLGGGCMGPGYFMDYDYRFIRGHGLIKDPGGVLWLITISKKFGVQASKAVIIPKSDTKAFRDKATALGDFATLALLDELGAIPVGTTEPIAGDPVYTLIDAESMKEVYGSWTAHNRLHGWAFSPAAPEAAHALMRRETDGSLSFSRWSIKFTWGVGATPIAATLTKEEETLNVTGWVRETPVTNPMTDPNTGDVTRDLWRGCPEDFPRDLQHVNADPRQRRQWYTKRRAHAVGRSLYFYAGTTLAPKVVPDPNPHDVPLFVFYDNGGALVQVRHLDTGSGWGPAKFAQLSQFRMNDAVGLARYDPTPYVNEFLSGQSWASADVYFSTDTAGGIIGLLDTGVQYGCYVIYEADALDVRTRSPRFGLAREGQADAWGVVPDQCREAFYFGYLHAVELADVGALSATRQGVYVDGGALGPAPPGYTSAHNWPTDVQIALQWPWGNSFLPHTFQERRTPININELGDGAVAPAAVFEPDLYPATLPYRVAIPVPVYAVGARRRSSDAKILTGVVGETADGVVGDPNPGATYAGTEFKSGVPWMSARVVYSARFFVSRASRERTTDLHVQAVPEYDEESFVKLFKRNAAVRSAVRQNILWHPFCHVPIPRAVLSAEYPSDGEVPDGGVYSRVRSVYSLPCAYSVFGSDKAGGNVGSVVCVGPYTDVGTLPVYYDRIAFDLEGPSDVSGWGYAFRDGLVVAVDRARESPLRCYPHKDLIEQKHFALTVFTMPDKISGRVPLGAYFIGYV